MGKSLQEIDNSQQLSRRERRKLIRDEKKTEKLKNKKNKKILSWIFGVIVIVSLLAFIWSFVKNSTRSLPGEEVTDLGRDHVTDIAGIEYSSNPPSSGPHFAVWAKPGVYDRLISDGYLIHSLEHGYIVISYYCSRTLSVNRFAFTVSAHDEPAEESTDSGELLKHMKVQTDTGMSWFTPENPPEVEVELPEEFKSESCESLVSQLSEYTKVAERIIIVPRVDMESVIALTAWGRILKLNSIEDEKIRDFIKSYHNRGPEITVE